MVNKLRLIQLEKEFDELLKVFRVVHECIVRLGLEEMIEEERIALLADESEMDRIMDSIGFFRGAIHNAV
jgi:hypothetical protein